MKALAPLVASLLFGLCSAVTAAPITLKVAHFLPPSSPGHKDVIQPWCEAIKADSDGQLQCQIYPAMQLGGTPAQLLNQVRDGVADVVWTLPGYNPGMFPISEVFELPFMTTTAPASSRALWDFINDYAQAEFADVKLIAAWISGPYQIHTRKTAVRKLSDLAGLKIRAPSRLSTRLLSALGATPVGMPVPQITEALSKGVIDGAMAPWEVLPATKAHELTQYHTDVVKGRTLATSTMVLLMNPARYHSLSPELQAVIDKNSGATTSAWISEQFAQADAVGLQAAQERGNEIIYLTTTQTEHWEAAALTVTEQWIQQMNQQHKGAELVKAARSLVDKYTKK